MRSRPRRTYKLSLFAGRTYRAHFRAKRSSCALIVRLLRSTNTNKVTVGKQCPAPVRPILRTSRSRPRRSPKHRCCYLLQHTIRTCVSKETRVACCVPTQEQSPRWSTRTTETTTLPCLNNNNSQLVIQQLMYIPSDNKIVGTCSRCAAQLSWQRIVNSCIFVFSIFTFNRKKNTLKNHKNENKINKNTNCWDCWPVIEWTAPVPSLLRTILRTLKKN